MPRFALLCAVLVACGDRDGSALRADASMAPDAPDAMSGYAACREFDAPGMFPPVHIDSVLAGSDVQSPSQCTVVDAPYGIESAGPDKVIRIDGLAPGNGYIVQLQATSDLAFYVATGCSTPSGPSSEQCALFVDASTGTQEIGRFVAQHTFAYVIVDYYASASPTNESFTLDVYAEACTNNGQCAASLPVCLNGRCVACASSFDCHDPSSPRCDTATTACVAGVDSCTTDDPGEPEDDGPAGAIALVPNGNGTATATGHICSSPRTEADFYTFTVAAVGEIWDLSLAWTGSRDLDLEVYDATGGRLGMSYHEQPERVRLTYLTPGTYYVKVSDLSATSTTPVSYTVSVQRTRGQGCTSGADCAREYRNQVYRAVCQAGSCVRLDGMGQIAEGEGCDSVSDCTSGTSCSSFYFVANADTRDVCARTCTSDNDCAPLGNYVCTTYLIANFCVQKCTSDAQCPTSLESTPVSGPWYRLSCQLATGHCVP